MGIVSYLTTSTDEAYSVRDLVPSPESLVSRVLVFESPHKQEIKEHLPVVGTTGERVLSFISADEAGKYGSLGRFVQALNCIVNSDIAVMNVSSVPLQCKAYAIPADSPLLGDAWKLLEKYRKAWSAEGPLPASLESAVTVAVAEDFQARFARLQLAPDYVVVPWGGVARRFTSFVAPDHLPQHTVAHPGRPDWLSLVRGGDSGLLEARQLVLAGLPSSHGGIGPLSGTNPICPPNPRLTTAVGTY